MTKTVVINDISYPVYADLEDANTYNNAIVGSTWAEKVETVKKQFLVMATRKIDSYKFAGEKIDSKQPLCFPRIMSNGKISDTQTLINLCCQVASYYQTNGYAEGGGDNGAFLSSLKEFKIGDLQANFKDNSAIEFSGIEDEISKALSDWMLGNGMEIWL